MNVLLALELVALCALWPAYRGCRGILSTYDQIDERTRPK